MNLMTSCNCDHGWTGTTDEGPIWCEDCQEGVTGALNTLTGHLLSLVVCLQTVNGVEQTSWVAAWREQLRDELKRGLVKRRQLKRRLNSLVEQESAAGFAKNYDRLSKRLADRGLLKGDRNPLFQPGR